ncbi:MAG: hypothetical protein ACOC2U_01560 [bacterium]
MSRVLFICTGNIFRSLVAETLLRKEIQKQKNTAMQCESAGIRVNSGSVRQLVINLLVKEYCDVSAFRQQQVTADMVHKADVIICMTKEHKTYMQKHFSCKTFLFNEILNNEENELFDEAEIKKQKTLEKTDDELTVQQFNEIKKSISKIYEFILNFYK